MKLGVPAALAFGLAHWLGVAVIVWANTSSLDAGSRIAVLTTLLTALPLAVLLGAVTRRNSIEATKTLILRDDLTGLAHGVDRVAHIEGDLIAQLRFGDFLR